MNTLIKLIRKKILLAVILSIAGMPVWSQKTIEVTHSKLLMSKGSQSCYAVEIPQSDPNTVQQAWIKELQENNKAKVKQIGQELVFTGAVKNEFSPDTVNIYSLIIIKDSLVSLNMFLEIDSVFFSPKEDKADLASEKIESSIKNYLRTFAVEQYRIAVTDELELQQKALETLEDELKDLEKDEENMKKEISKMENDIEEEEREISSLDQKIDLKQQEILTHTTGMQTIVLETEKKAAQDKQKVLEKEKKQLEKERSRAKDDIASYKSDIEKNEKDIEDGIELQEEKKTEIENQTGIVGQVQKKLDGIK